ncbi:hypothetical protein PISMIDRAFT_484255 [Pisolithus microcarpus 441]|uniref:Uncharacterized protein n=1 Tax=Pisolithus microcarpus 441 TaxID=765257 RepID=A0A0C9ZJR2_9AGAM|nr:hypothetical protein BKA83DRAFT_484255 [Pisolithus microcarpus]KIK29501.1 hypothetical protein PISMIDRAFT_484255 [Pisolithus microcarpus 441]
MSRNEVTPKTGGVSIKRAAASVSSRRPLPSIMNVIPLMCIQCSTVLFFFGFISRSYNYD